MATPGRLILGSLIAGYGIGLGVDSIVDWSNGDSWTVSLGGVLAGVCLGVIALSALARRHRLRPLPSALIAIGNVAAGYFLGGGFDDLLRRAWGED